jgi:periplasmic mercuric ion binding protein
MMRAAGFVWLSLSVLPAMASPSELAVLDVKGMDCAACPITVKTVLGKQAGVGDVKVDVQKQTAVVRFDAAMVTPDKLAQSVTEAGFPASPRK